MRKSWRTGPSWRNRATRSVILTMWAAYGITLTRDLSYDETGIGSWYGDEFAGRLTANGEIFDPTKITAAHKTLPMPSVVRVTNLDNGRSLVVRINDRGPFVAGTYHRSVARGGASASGFKDAGIAKVQGADC